MHVWSLALSDLQSSSEGEPTAVDAPKANGAAAAQGSVMATEQVGRLLGTYRTGNRITCLAAFVMTGTAEEADSALDEVDDEGVASSSDESE